MIMNTISERTELAHRVSGGIDVYLFWNEHTRELKHAGEPDERINTVAVWRDVSYFTEAERAALALTDAATRLADRSDPVPDDVWDSAARHYDETQLAALVLAIAAINAWNRLNVTTRQIGGDWVSQWVASTREAA